MNPGIGTSDLIGRGLDVKASFSPKVTYSFSTFVASDGLSVTSLMSVASDSMVAWPLLGSVSSSPMSRSYSLGVYLNEDLLVSWIISELHVYETDSKEKEE